MSGIALHCERRNVTSVELFACLQAEDLRALYRRVHIGAFKVASSFETSSQFFFLRNTCKTHIV